MIKIYCNKIALENISNVPDVCSGMLRIGALQLQHFLGGRPPNPPPYLPPRRLRRLCDALCHLTPPPLGKNFGIRPGVIGYQRS